MRCASCRSVHSDSNRAQCTPTQWQSAPSTKHQSRHKGSWPVASVARVHACTTRKCICTSLPEPPGQRIRRTPTVSYGLPTARSSQFLQRSFTLSTFLRTFGYLRTLLTAPASPRRRPCVRENRPPRTPRTPRTSRPSHPLFLFLRFRSHPSVSLRSAWCTDVGTRFAVVPGARGLGVVLSGDASSRTFARRRYAASFTVADVWSWARDRRRFSFPGVLSSMTEDVRIPASEDMARRFGRTPWSGNW